MKPTLVVLAAGVGSRFGGLKQLEPVGPGGSPLMDFTIYDALRNGFGRIVMVVRHETDALFRKHIENGMNSKADVVLVHQELDSLPRGFTPPPSRTKPWGTGHAVLVAAPAVNCPFAVVNADDYYGPEGLEKTAGFLASGSKDSSGSEPWAMVGYRLGNTLPDSGSVSRGLCHQDETGHLLGLNEVLKIWREGESAKWIDDQGKPQLQPFDTLVSMNLWGFTKSFMTRLENDFNRFLENAPSDTTEFLLPDAVTHAIKDHFARVEVLTSESEWFGMTSPDDREVVQRRLVAMVKAGVYPRHLWRP